MWNVMICFFFFTLLGLEYNTAQDLYNFLSYPPPVVKALTQFMLHVHWFGPRLFRPKSIYTLRYE